MSLTDDRSRNTESSTIADDRSIVEYYSATTFDYRLFWRSRSQMALHMGYWDATTTSFAEALQRENEVLAEWAGVHASDRVLDAGCGVGGSSIFLARTIGCRVLGITLCPPQVRTASRNAARSKVRELVDFEVRDFVSTGLPDASFDVVWAVESVSHSARKVDFLREAYRVLRPGGRLIVADGFMVKDDLSHDEAALMRSWMDGWSMAGFATLDRFRRDLRTVGFDVAREQDATDNVLPSSQRLFRLARLRHVEQVLYTLRLRSKAAHGNMVGARNQYLAVQQGLCGYHLFLGVKPV
ncbi:MAG: methyltransferase domain-containing protein [Sporichthyaceae bacterium]